jgi:hypothetical protein
MISIANNLIKKRNPHVEHMRIPVCKDVDGKKGFPYIEYNILLYKTKIMKEDDMSKKNLIELQNYLDSLAQATEKLQDGTLLDEGLRQELIRREKEAFLHLLIEAQKRALTPLFQEEMAIINKLIRGIISESH